MPVKNGGMKTFSFLWKRLDKPGWHQRTLPANTPQEAIEAMKVHLAKRADFPANVVVDHPFYEKENGTMLAMHTLTNFTNPFPVMYGNVVQRIEQYTRAA